MKRCLVCLLAAACAGLAAAEGTYRCEQGGRTTYQQSPCTGGREVPVDDARSAAQRREASEAARRDAALAQQLQRERTKAEKAAARTGPAGIGATTAKSGAKATGKNAKSEAASKDKKKPAKGKSAKAQGADFRAIGPAPSTPATPLR